MTEALDVRIVTLAPMRIAYAHGFGPSPEGIAVNAIMTWARAHGALTGKHRFFGFNNPDPSPGSPNYGYEQWITVEPDAEPSGDIRIKTFDGGLYAVTRCKLANIGATWKALAAWRENSRYTHGHHQWLEEAITPFEPPYEEIVIDIYLPLAE